MVRLLCFVACFGGVMTLLTAALYAQRARVLHRLTDCDVGEPLGLARAAWAFIAECVATAAIVWSVPLGWFLPRDAFGRGTRGPVLLVHGWSLNRGCFWMMRRRLLRDGWSPVCCFDYRTLGLDVEGAAAQLRVMVDHLVQAGGGQRPLMLIGHSLGGLVLRYYARRYPAPHVRRIVTLGTPHGGTALAPSAGGTIHKLNPSSPFLKTLCAADRVPQQFDVIAIHSSFDAMILPPHNAEYPGAFNIEIAAVGHNTLLFSAKVYQLIAENLAAPLR